MIMMTMTRVVVYSFIDDKYKDKNKGFGFYLFDSSYISSVVIYVFFDLFLAWAKVIK